MCISPVPFPALSVLLRCNIGVILVTRDRTMDEWLAEEMVKNRDEFKASWLRDYPTETIWYSFSAVERKDSGYRAIFVGHKMVIEVDPRKNRSFENDISEFAQWILEAVTESCEELKSGTYAQLVEAGIPPEQRTGTITRKESVHDEYDYIEWWLYETTDYKVWTEDGTKEWDLKEPEALYDYIVNECD